MKRLINAGEIQWLRKELRMSTAVFGRLMNVDNRTVANWEKNKSLPNAAPEAVLIGLVHVLKDSPDIKSDIEFIRSASSVGGLSYLIIKLFNERWEA